MRREGSAPPAGWPMGLAGRLQHDASACPACVRDGGPPPTQPPCPAGRKCVWHTARRAHHRGTSQSCAARWQVRLWRGCCGHACVQQTRGQQSQVLWPKQLMPSAAPRWHPPSLPAAAPAPAERGLRGLYQGYTAGLANSSVALAMSFATYEVRLGAAAIVLGGSREQRRAAGAPPGLPAQHTVPPPLCHCSSPVPPCPSTVLPHIIPQLFRRRALARRKGHPGRRRSSRHHVCLHAARKRDAAHAGAGAARLSGAVRGRGRLRCAGEAAGRGGGRHRVGMGCRHGHRPDTCSTALPPLHSLPLCAPAADAAARGRVGVLARQPLLFCQGSTFHRSHQVGCWLRHPPLEGCCLPSVPVPAPLVPVCS